MFKAGPFNFSPLKATTEVRSVRIPKADQDAEIAACRKDGWHLVGTDYQRDGQVRLTFVKWQVGFLGVSKE
jgi:hypothetical protein